MVRYRCYERHGTECTAQAYALHCAFQIVTMSSLLTEGLPLALTSSMRTLMRLRLDRAQRVIRYTPRADSGPFLDPPRQRSHRHTNSRESIPIQDPAPKLTTSRDGTAAAIVPLMIGAVLFFAPTLYISLDTAFSWTSVFQIPDNGLPDLKSIGLFILTLVWPAMCARACSPDRKS